MPTIDAGSPVILRTASASDKARDSRTYWPNSRGNVPNSRGCAARRAVHAGTYIQGGQWLCQGIATVRAARGQNRTLGARGGAAQVWEMARTSSRVRHECTALMPRAFCGLDTASAWADSPCSEQAQAGTQPETSVEDLR